ncbi:MAG TPA: short chain isoprenyl diphosphate synthase IdsA [Methanobacteriaceae archaeon]|nr:short chain isoprenyl diphosphate synthase IdsA [Methanobacteriaceae archaeon]
MEVIGILEKYSENVQKEINAALSTVEPEALQESSLHLVKAGGKMIRPALAILSAEAVGGKAEDAMKTAAAVELIHTFSLIHDDIMDQDDKRRGQPSVHVLWGDAMAILAGDTLFSKAFETVLWTEQDGVDSQMILSALQTVVDSCVKICEGQASDMGFAEQLEVSEEEYLHMIYKKTAALIAAATRSGAILGGGTKQQVEALTEYGKLIGLAFQIQDDYLDVVSDEENLGKPVGSDIAEGKRTLLVVHTMEAASPEDREELITILKEKSDQNVPRAIEIFQKYGSIDYAHHIAHDNVKQAKELLTILDDSPSRTALMMLADFVLERSH